MADSERQTYQHRRFEDFLETVDSQNNTLLSGSYYQSTVKALKGEKSIWTADSLGKRTAVFIGSNIYIAIRSCDTFENCI